MKLTLFTDGAARGNPGPAGGGVVLYNERNEVVEEYCRYLGTATNNAAEYEALLDGLERAQKYLPCRLHVNMDSELVVRQVTGRYRVKNEALKVYCTEAVRRLSRFEQVVVSHVPREKNARADALANRAIDEATATKAQ